VHVGVRGYRSSGIWFERRDAACIRSRDGNFVSLGKGRQRVEGIRGTAGRYLPSKGIREIVQSRLLPRHAAGALWTLSGDKGRVLALLRSPDGPYQLGLFLRKKEEEFVGGGSGTYLRLVGEALLPPLHRTVERPTADESHFKKPPEESRMAGHRSSRDAKKGKDAKETQPVSKNPKANGAETSCTPSPQIDYRGPSKRN